MRICMALFVLNSSLTFILKAVHELAKLTTNYYCIEWCKKSSMEKKCKNSGSFYV